MTPHPQREVFLSDQRWFAGKGRAFAVTGVQVVARLDERVRIELVEVTYDEGDPRTEVYQMPVVGYPEAQDRLTHALVRHGDGEWTYDALHDRDAMGVIYRALTNGVTAEDPGDLQVHKVAPVDEHGDVHSTFLPAEQSNSSAVFGETAILKVFRKLTPGRNPDVEIHAALTEAGEDHLARLYGWLSSSDHDLAMLQQFLRTASDGWEVAKHSVRNLLTEDDVPAEEAGGDFGGDARRLGAAVAAVHASLRGVFEETVLDVESLGRTMTGRLDAALEVVDDLSAYEEALRTRFADVVALREQAEIPAHRIHGDLHLGQTLRTSLGWKLVDFEGEPARPLEERRLPDSPLRDVAGMLRSFDYAAASTLRDLESSDPEDSPLAVRAREWVAHNGASFLEGYVEERGAPLSKVEKTLLDAYVLDKAVYEAAYEARNRPTWLDIPMHALARLAAP